jgi:hypothetical protein
MKLRKKRRHVNGWLRQLPLKVRVTDAEYELLAREALENGFQDKNDYYLFRLIPKNAEKRLEELRAKHRSMGKPDHEFWHHRRKREMGIKSKPGRQQKPEARDEAA